MEIWRLATSGHGLHRSSGSWSVDGYTKQLQLACNLLLYRTLSHVPLSKLLNPPTSHLLHILFIGLKLTTASNTSCCHSLMKFSQPLNQHIWLTWPLSTSLQHLHLICCHPYLTTYGTSSSLQNTVGSFWSNISVIKSLLLFISLIPIILVWFTSSSHTALVIIFCWLTTLTIDHSLTFSFPAQNSPASQILPPQIHSSLSSELALWSTTYDWFPR